MGGHETLVPGWQAVLQAAHERQTDVLVATFQDNGVPGDGMAGGITERGGAHGRADGRARLVGPALLNKPSYGLDIAAPEGSPVVAPVVSLAAAACLCSLKNAW